MTKNKQIRDPYAAREAAKYASPIPSREYILAYLQDCGRPVPVKRLYRELLLTDPESQNALQYRLRAMARDGQLVKDRRGRYGLAEKMELVPGRVVGHVDGYGFVIPDDGGDEYYLSPRQMRQAFHGDRVLVRLVGIDRRGRLEGAIHEVIERNTQKIVGRLSIEQGIAFVEPDNRRLSKTISIPTEHLAGAKAGQIVTVNILSQPSKRSQPIGAVEEILGDHMAPGMEIDVAIRSFQIPYAWSNQVAEELARIPECVAEQDRHGRQDLRKQPFVTIDGADARDFDDAVFCQPHPKGGWRLSVAIADVSHYVKADSALDKEAARRGNSIYFPERVIPMLPEKLSNGLCSLNPAVDRLVLVCQMTISDQGKIANYRFVEGVIHSHARLTYDEVAEMLAEEHGKAAAQYATVYPQLRHLYNVFQALHRARQRRGAIDFDTVETGIVFSAAKKIEQIKPVVRNDAHRLIEECMLAANVCAAKFLLKNAIPSLYRIHAQPGLAKLENLREFLADFGLTLAGGKKPKARDYRKLLEEIKQRVDYDLIQTVLLRSLCQAEYSPHNIGHFGLAYTAYTHFTSPIRRYPDLLVHRAIRFVIQQQPIQRFPYTLEDMEHLGKHCSFTERRADEATRDAIDWLKCEYMLDKVGQVFSGKITSVTNFGLFVQLSDIFVDGLVHITSLWDDYYHFDPVKHRLRGERTGDTYRLGDPLEVRLVRVDLDERKIDFDLVNENE